MCVFDGDCSNIVEKQTEEDGTQDMLEVHFHVCYGILGDVTPPALLNVSEILGDETFVDEEKV